MFLASRDKKCIDNFFSRSEYEYRNTDNRVFGIVRNLKVLNRFRENHKKITYNMIKCMYLYEYYVQSSSTKNCITINVMV